MMEIEDSFPRGGNRPRLSVKRPKENDNLFSEIKHKTKKQRTEKKQPVEIINDDTFHSALKIQGTLSYSNLKTDLIVLGCVRRITDFSIEVELPGIIFGYINVTNISDPFTKYLNSKLEQADEADDTLLKSMFKIGQYVMTKVINIEKRDKGVYVECTLNPREIYNGRSHSSFEKGMLIWAAVQSELEHGFEINVGVKHCRVFLPFTHTDKGKKYVTGEPLWCTIQKCDISNTATTLRVSSKIEHLKKSQIDEINNLYDLFPGMKVQMMVDKITDNGIQCKFLNDFFGYIDEGFLTKSLSKYEEGSLLYAYILYIDHTVKITYFTTFELDVIPTPKYEIGEVVIGEVTSKIYKGICLKLPSKEKCIVTNKRLINSLPKKYANLDVSETILLKFAVKSRHSCRILDYNYLSRTYIGTVEQNLIKEKLFSPKDAIIGQLVEVVVEKIKPDGLVVSAGHVKGFVPNLYLSNVKYSDTIKKKFREGQKLKARVLTIDDNKILLTVKPSQVEAEECLTDLSLAKRGDFYPGVVIQTKPTGVLVVFYGNVKGWISKKSLDDEDDEQKPDPQQMFFRGQVVKPWVLGVLGDRVRLSLRQPKKFDISGKLSVGQTISGVVADIKRDKLYVKTKRGRRIGFVPLNQLSCNLNLCPVLLKTYKIGDNIDNLICISNTPDSNLLSRRESLALKRYPKLKPKKFEKLVAGNIIRCSYVSDCETGIYVLPLIYDYSEKILIRKKDIVDKNTTLPKFQSHQSIVTKIIKIDHETKNIRLTAKFSEVFNNKVESVLNLFSEYLSDIQKITAYGKENNWDICNYEPGTKLPCHIEKLGDNGGCLVKLPNGINGLVAPVLCPGTLKEGETITGTFLSQNFNENYAEICLSSDICQRINQNQDGKISCENLTSCMAENILLKQDYAIALLKEKEANRQFIYIPLYLHENDFSGCREIYANNKLKLCVCGKVNNFLIGMKKNLFVKLDKKREKLNKIIFDRIDKTKSKDKLDVSNNKEDNENHKESNPRSETEKQSEEDIDIVEESETESNSDEDNVLEDLETENNSENLDEDSDEENHVSEQDSETDINIDVSEDSNIKRKNVKIGDSNEPTFISGVNSFFSTNTNTEEVASSDEDIEEVWVKKKKKLSASERAQLAREEEERISKIEKELADPTRTPESAAQFDRLLLANPNSSDLWIKYIAFHTATTEFDKARVVAKRALEAINMTLIEERFNIWIALLNLENMVGTKESFDETFDKAVQYNDSLKIYLKVIQLLAESGKLADMEEKIKKVRNKYKQVTEMWLEVSKTYYQLGKFKEARNMKDAALKSISNKKTQLEIIVRFAIMEFKYGEADHGAAIFETILSSDPRKVSIWTTYVDQLAKKGKIDEARHVLERSVCQRLPLKSIKSLFLKFRMFEEQYGTPKTLEEVKQKAKEYVSKTTNSS